MCRAAWQAQPPTRVQSSSEELRNKRLSVGQGLPQGHDEKGDRRHYIRIPTISPRPRSDKHISFFRFTGLRVRVSPALRVGNPPSRFLASRTPEHFFHY